MPPNLKSEDVLYTAQPGDRLSAIADRFREDTAAFDQIVEGNAGREQTRARKLTDRLHVSGLATGLARV